MEFAGAVRFYSTPLFYICALLLLLTVCLADSREIPERWLRR